MNNGRWCIKPTWNHLSTYSTFHCWSIILWMTSVYCVHESKYHDWCIKIFATSCMIIFNWLFGILMVQNIPRCKKKHLKTLWFQPQTEIKIVLNSPLYKYLPSHHSFFFPLPQSQVSKEVLKTRWEKSTFATKSIHYLGAITPYFRRGGGGTGDLPLIFKGESLKISMTSRILFSIMFESFSLASKINLKLLK